jgi:hypothetical protein
MTAGIYLSDGRRVRLSINRRLHGPRFAQEYREVAELSELSARERRELLNENDWPDECDRIAAIKIRPMQARARLQFARS